MKQLKNLEECWPLEFEFVESLAKALGMESLMAVQMLFRTEQPTSEPSDLGHIHVRIHGIFKGHGAVNDLLRQYNVGGRDLTTTTRGRARSSVHMRTGRTPGARGYSGGDYNIYRDGY